MRRRRFYLPPWLIHWLPAVAAVGMIAGESTATMSSEHTSRWLLPLWVKLFGAVSPARWEEIHFFIRKSGHFIGYGLVSLAFYHGWRWTLDSSRRHSVWYHRIRAAWWALFWTLVVSSGDEFHQSFLPGRTSSGYDVCLDMCGALAAHLVLFVVLAFMGGDSWLRRTAPDSAGWA